MSKVNRLAWAGGALLCLACGASVAGSAADGLGQCMVDSTSGKDRKALATWIYIAMSAHPSVKKYARVNEEIEVDVSRNAGTIVTRLLTEDCVEQARAALTTEGTPAVGSAFEALGRAAVQELMADPAVDAVASALSRYVDEGKIRETFGAE